MMQFKRKLEIIPHIGFGPVKLGMSREDVMSVLGDANYCGSHESSDYYYFNSLQVEFLSGKADFIGISFSEQYEALYHGNNIFDMEAHKLFDLIAENEDKNHHFDESEYFFPDQIITLWDADEQYDRLGSEARMVWAQLGLGARSYLESARKYI